MLEKKIKKMLRFGINSDSQVHMVLVALGTALGKERPSRRRGGGVYLRGWGLQCISNNPGS